MKCEVIGCSADDGAVPIRFDVFGLVFMVAVCAEHLHQARVAAARINSGTNIAADFGPLPPSS